MPFHMQNLPSELQYLVLSKFQPKTLCRYRQTCKLVNNIVESYRKRLNVTDYDDLWVLFVQISRGEEPEVQFTVRQDKYTDDSFHDFDSGNSILIEFPFNQLSCIRFEVVYVKFHHQFGANDDGHEVFQSEKQSEVFAEEVLPVLKKMAIKCEWLVCVNMNSQQAVEVVKSVNFSRLHTRRVEVNVEDVFRWPLESSNELYLHGIRGTPNSLRELNLRTERTDFFFCEEVNLFELLEEYLKDIQDGKINIRKMKKIKLWRSGRVPYGEVLNLPGLEISWKGELYRGPSRGMFGRDILYKMVVGEGMVLISQIKRAFFVNFVHNGTSREDSLDHFHQFFFRRRPYDYSAYFEEFKKAATDQEAFDMLRDRYLYRYR